jgi:ketosteroid isomerase-like protein
VFREEILEAALELRKGDDPLTNRDVLEAAYAAFNARDIDRALAVMHHDVVWANGMEGGYVYGHRGVREYWTRQWALIDPRVYPLRFESVASQRIVQHVFSFDDGGLITRMEIAGRP